MTFFFPTEDVLDCPQTEVVSNLAHTLILCSPDTISLSHRSEYTTDHSCSFLHHSCARTNGFELALGSTHPPSGRGQQKYVPMLIAIAATSYHTPSVILMPGLTLDLWPALFLWKYSGHYLSLVDLSQHFTYIRCPTWLLLTMQHKWKWQLPFIPSIQSCWT